MNAEYKQLAAVVEFLSEARQIRALEQAVLGLEPATRQLQLDLLRGKVIELNGKYASVLSDQPERVYLEGLRAMYAKPQTEAEPKPEPRMESKPKYEGLDRSVKELGLSTRVKNALTIWNNDLTVGDLVKITEAQLLKTKNVGEGSLDEVRKCLENLGLRLGMTRSELYE